MKFIKKNIFTAVFFSAFAILLGGHSFLAEPMETTQATLYGTNQPESKPQKILWTPKAHSSKI